MSTPQRALKHLSKIQAAADEAQSEGDPRPAIAGTHWSYEQYIDNVNIKILYTPHTLIALGVTVLALITVAFTVDTESRTRLENARLGVGMAFFTFVVLGMLVFPSGPFIRPHPQVWRIAFAVGVIYELFLIVILFLGRDDARKAFTFFDSSLAVPLKEKEYATHCELTWPNIKNAVLDIFVISHFLGWLCKALMVRDALMCWVMSITWEVLELAFLHMLPNFAECWWDQWILDVLLSNGLGITVGTYLCRHLEMRQYKWTDHQNITTAWGKISRVAMQFTPERWTRVRWESTSSLKRYFTVHFIIVFMQVEELNAFFLKHILWVPSESILNVVRLAIWFFMGLPAVRQLYLYSTDPSCIRLGTQAWLAVITLVTELCVIVKHGRGMFTKQMDPNLRAFVIVFFTSFVLVSLILAMRIRSRETITSDTEEDRKRK